MRDDRDFASFHLLKLIENINNNVVIYLIIASTANARMSVMVIQHKHKLLRGLKRQIFLLHEVKNKHLTFL